MSPRAALLVASFVACAGVARASDGPTEASAEDVLRDCEARIASGPRRAAVLACADALQRKRSDQTVRALVSAFVDGPEAPSNADIVQALAIISKEHDNPLGQVTAAAAACDVAERIGEGPMLQQCASDLERLAPNDPAATKARAALAARCPPWRFWSGWGALAAFFALTIADAVRRVQRSRAARTSLAAAASFALVFAGAPRTVLAQDKADGAAPSSSTTFHALGKWPIDTTNPESSIPPEAERNADPLQFGYWLQDVASRAERASKAGDHAQAARLYGALAKAVPDRAIGFVKQCEELEANGDIPGAVRACADSLLRNGLRVADYTHFVHLMIAKPGDLDDRDRAALKNVLSHMREDPASQALVDDLQCQVAARTSDVDELQACVTPLAARAPNDAKTLSYEWALAVAQGKFDEARGLGERARAAGVPDESLASMMRVAAEGEARHRWRVVLGIASLVLLAAAGVVGAAAWWRMRRAPVGSELGSTAA